MGITKDLVTGIWVGADDRSVHFTTSETGEGSHTALPIFGAFMEKVYADPKSGYTYGPFPKPWVKITKEYVCPSPIIREDTTTTDSLTMPLDSAVIVPPPATEENSENKTPPPHK
jgi:penicillin-binding protein 1A